MIEEKSLEINCQFVEELVPLVNTTFPYSKKEEIVCGFLSPFQMDEPSKDDPAIKQKLEIRVTGF